MSQGILGQQDGTTSAAAIYTAGAGIESINLLMYCVEYAGVDGTVTIYVDQDGDAAANGNRVYSEYPISANDTLRLSLPSMTGGGGKVYVQMSSGGESVNFTLHGVERIP